MESKIVNWWVDLRFAQGDLILKLKIHKYVCYVKISFRSSSIICASVPKSVVQLITVICLTVWRVFRNIIVTVFLFMNISYWCFGIVSSDRTLSHDALLATSSLAIYDHGHSTGVGLIGDWGVWFIGVGTGYWEITRGVIYNVSCQKWNNVFRLSRHSKKT
jgi:hypothetical protein